MGYAIHPSLIVLLIMLGAAFLVAMGFGVSRIYGTTQDHMLRPMSNEQAGYMREVRERGMQGLYWEGRRSQYRGKGTSMSAMTPDE
ncbi:hypothetical protein EJ04DRAFT_431394 [Polyplosphaeria fusca]|uniref:Uncharacterized protein n=1 Tax=Polyplosphaeria fusca TaxID=682080 RepID=A0A9P4R698_9PLEO|nr:hypothetical protein EJ04DRAFT_431394 [Polyplosphaeria fusca]